MDLSNYFHAISTCCGMHMTLEYWYLGNDQKRNPNTQLYPMDLMAI